MTPEHPPSPTIPAEGPRPSGGRRRWRLWAGLALVLLGSLVQTQWVGQNDVVVVENVPLGRVTARFD